MSFWSGCGRHGANIFTPAMGNTSKLKPPGRYQKRIDEMNDELARIRDFPPTLTGLTVPARFMYWIRHGCLISLPAFARSAIDPQGPRHRNGHRCAKCHSPRRAIDVVFLPGTYEVFSHERWGESLAGCWGSRQGVQSDGYHWYKVGTTQ